MAVVVLSKTNSVEVSYADLNDTLLSADKNNKRCPYKIKLTGTTPSYWVGSTGQASSVGKILRANLTKFVDLSETEIPSDTVSLFYSFSGCTNLVKSPKIPDSVISMDYTFYNCTNLDEIPGVPSTIPSITDTFTNVPETALAICADKDVLALWKSKVTTVKFIIGKKIIKLDNVTNAASASLPHINDFSIDNNSEAASAGSIVTNSIVKELADSLSNEFSTDTLNVSKSISNSGTLEQKGNSTFTGKIIADGGISGSINGNATTASKVANSLTVESTNTYTETSSISYDGSAEKSLSIYTPNQDVNSGASPTFGIVTADLKGNSATSNFSQNGMVVGSIYTQYPNQATPDTLFGGTWENISSLYAGYFFRAEGGNANTFGTAQSYAIQAHSHTIESSGAHSHTIESNGSHSHTISGGAHTHSWYAPIAKNTAGDGNNGAYYGTNPCKLYEWTTINSDNSSHTHSCSSDGSHSHTCDSAGSHSHTCDSTGSNETRPMNYSIRIWKKTA